MSKAASVLIIAMSLGSAFGQPDSMAGVPPPEAFEPCKGLAAGAACTINTPGGAMQGTCADFQEGMLCVLEGFPRPPEGQRPSLAAGHHRPQGSEPTMPPEALVPPMRSRKPEPPGAAMTPPATPPYGGVPYGGVLLGAALALAGMLAYLRWKDPRPAVAAAPAVGAQPVLSAPALQHRAVGLAGGRILAGHYEILHEIGRGGMGIVYQAKDLKLDRPVAIKRMQDEIAADSRGRERFLVEARTVARLSHPNIVAIHAILEETDGLYLVFEYVDGESVDALIERRQRLPPGEALPLLQGAADAVDYAHGQRVIHRDLKPGNIMVDMAGRPKVMDFGLAHQAKVTISRLTRTQAFGTMAYMPPEQELGEAVRESDVFAFAALSYEALTGDVPFPGPNFYQQKVSSFFKRPSAMMLPSATDRVFERAFEPEPKRRFPTAGEFLAGLREALASC